MDNDFSDANIRELCSLSSIVNSLIYNMIKQMET